MNQQTSNSDPNINYNSRLVAGLPDEKGARVTNMPGGTGKWHEMRMDVIEIEQREVPRAPDVFNGRPYTTYTGYVVLDGTRYFVNKIGWDEDPGGPWWQRQPTQFTSDGIKMYQDKPYADQFDENGMPRKA